MATMTADDDAWPERDQPSGNLGRIFVLLLLLHVFIIGAVVIYNMIAPKSSAIAKTETVPAAIDKTKATTGTKIVTAPRSTIPALASVATPVAAENRQPEIGTYEVRSGDNVPAIVAKLGITADDLIKQNNLNSTDLYPGRKLQYTKKATSLPVTLAPSQVVTFNTSSGTAKPNPLKAIDLAPLPSSLPKKNDNSISSSDSLPKAIPVKSQSVDHSDTPPAPMTKPKDDNGTSAKPKSKNDTNKTATNKPSKDTTGKRTYVVTSKDTLYSVAKKYGVKVAALQKANDIKDPTTLKNGTRLIIPSKN